MLSLVCGNQNLHPLVEARFRQPSRDELLLRKPFRRPDNHSKLAFVFDRHNFGTIIGITSESLSTSVRNAYRHPPESAIYDQIREVMSMQGNLSVERMCALTAVSRAGFYRSLREREPDLEEMELRSAIQAIVIEHKLRYGYRRVRAMPHYALMSVRVRSRQLTTQTLRRMGSEMPSIDGVDEETDNDGLALVKVGLPHRPKGERAVAR